MRTIGLLGGMSWESTETYYRWINEEVRRRLGGLHSAELVLYSVDFQPIEAMQHHGDWDAAAKTLSAAAQRIEAAGADFLVICTNTMHKLAPSIERAIGIPLLHIADATADAARAMGVSTLGLLGTRFTMEREFYRGRLEKQHALSVLIPLADQRAAVHQVIYDELCCGVIRDSSRDALVQVIEDLRSRGAEAVILGCTEIPLLVRSEDVPLPLLDTTTIHAQRAVDWALDDAISHVADA
jgi:aspartate racemase